MLINPLNWMVIGDFKMKIGLDKVVGIPVLTEAKEEFINFNEVYSLYDLPYSSSRFTWYCKRDGHFI